MTPTGFMFMDPQDDDNGRTVGLCEKTEEAFKPYWYDTDTDAYERVNRWYMVINYAGRRFADEVGGGEDVVKSAASALRTRGRSSDRPA